MSKLSRDKGHGFERTTAIEFRRFFPQAKRQLEYQEGLGVDLADVGRFRIQCKRYKTYAPIAKIKEAGEVEGAIPALVTKGDREKVVIALYLEDFFKILEDPDYIYGERNGKGREEIGEAICEVGERDPCEVRS